MSQTTETFPIAINPGVRRLASIDVLRGLLMILMAIDHSRDYFSAFSRVDATDPLHSWAALFATRWITHLCAPGFVALAGVSVYLQRQRGKTAPQMSRLLLTRGLWLCFLEVTLISYAWSFAFGPGLQVIWAIGCSMIFLALLQWLPTSAIGIIGGLIVLLHNLLDPIHADRFGSASLLWKLLHQPGPLFIHQQIIGVAAYPIVPWIGVICLGYAFGPVALLAPARRERVAVSLGMCLLGSFAVLRVFHGYGDHNRFTRYGQPGETLMSFLQVEKYPPSLHYLLATLGILLLLYAATDFAVSREWLTHLRRFVETYGRVPFFYYILHILLLHTGALLLTASRHLDWRFWTVPGAVFVGHLAGWGYNLPGVYLAWATVVLLLYLPCRRFGELKAKRHDWWLSYL